MGRQVMEEDDEQELAIPVFPVNELAHRLYNTGQDITYISDLLDLEPSQVKDLLFNTEAQVKESEELRERMLRLANMAMDEAMKIIRYGIPQRRDPMIRAILGNLSKTLSKESTSDYSELRLALEQIFDQNRVGGPDLTDIPGFAEQLGLNAVEAHSSSFASDYSDEEAEIQET